MTRRMLINAIHPEECRVAIADDDQLLELEVERADSGQLRGNIYKATITRIEPSLQAAFLDIGAERNGFLQINDIHPTYFRNWPPANAPETKGRPSIQEVLDRGQDLVVQVVKDGRDAKGATLTTNISMPGRYLVLMIGSQRGGVSRKISDEGQRHKLRQAVERLKIPPGMGVIVRTAGINRTYAELQRDLDSLLDTWYSIVTKSFEPGTPKLLFQESNLAIRTIRDYLTGEIQEILIDDYPTYEMVRDFVNKTMPQVDTRVIYYEKPQPLFSNYHLDRQVEETNKPEVILPSGGSIVINVTEAIVAIDVNSGRSTGQSDVEETAFNTNKEAAATIAKQLRLRDLGGLVVIDFIDMWDKRHKQIVEKALKDAVRSDKAKVEMGRISKFGLLEMSRQRLKSSLVSQSHITCPHCSGRGRVKTAEAAALEALRKIQSAVCAGGVEAVRVRMAPGAALLLLNNKRKALTKLEETTGTTILVYADGRMKPEEYELELGAHHREARPAQEEQAERREPRQARERDRDRGRDQQRGRQGDERRRSRGRRRGRNDRNRNWNNQNRGQQGAPRHADQGEQQPQGGRDTAPAEKSSADSSSYNDQREAPILAAKAHEEPQL